MIDQQRFVDHRHTEKVDTLAESRTSDCPMAPIMLGNHTDADERTSRKPFEIKMRYKRQTLQDMTRPLKTWLYKHRDNPYPTKAEKMGLATDSNMTLTQVSNWFANARRRLKNTVSNPDLSWGNRVKMYNSCVKGNQELLSISSEDSAWESGEEGDHKIHQDVSSTGHDPLQARLTASPHQPLLCFPSSNQSQPQQDAPLSPSMVPLNLSRQATVPISASPEASSSLPSRTSTQHSSTQHSSTQQQQQQQQQQEHGRSPEQAHRIVSEMLQQHSVLYASSPSTAQSMPQQQQQQQPPQHTVYTSTPLQQQHNPHQQVDRAVLEQDMDIEQDSQPQQQHQHQPQQRTVSVCEPDCGNHGLTPAEVEQPPKFKSSILQRYLQDSYQHNIQLSHPVVNSTRHRNPSGSLSSHDYEDLSVSSRSTPTREMTSHDTANPAVEHRDEEMWKQWPQLEKGNEEFHWKEISAALALTALSQGTYPRPDTNTTLPASHATR